MNINKVYDMEKAIAIAKKLYKPIGKDENEINKLRPIKINGELVFLRFPNIKSNGLLNDFETRGIPVIRIDENYNAYLHEDI